MSDKEKEVKEQTEGQKEPKEGKEQKAKEGKAAPKQGKEAAKEGGGKDKKKKGKEEAQPQEKPKGKPSLQIFYENEVVPQLQKEHNFANKMELPRIKKVVINMGLGEAVANPKIIDGAVDEIANISGQKPIITRARKSIANFKLREGMQIGVKVTLRRRMMYEFLDRLMNVALPRVRDFRGVSPKAFDGKGNYTLGVQEQIIFPEINYDKIDKIKGLNITIVTSAKSDDHARSLLTYMGMPFRKK